MASFKEIMQVAKNEGAEYVQKCPDLDGESVWQLYFYDPNEGFQETGISTFVVFGKNGHKILNDEQALKYMQTIDEDFEPSPIKVL